MSATTTVIVDRAVFDEEGYMRVYPDIAQAVAGGKWPSAWHHYLAHGAKEGRRANDLDEEFYLNAYPPARLAIAQKRAKSAIDHYLRIGRGCGFLPNRKAPRVPNPSGFASEFGGLWIDQQNSASLIEGKQQIGQITAEQAEQLRFFAEKGYLVLPGAVPAKQVAAARSELDKAYMGGFPDLRFESNSVGKGQLPFHPDMRIHPAKALDLHYFSPAIRDVMFNPAITAFLGLIFEGKVFASQTLGFLRGSAQEGHQDSAYVVYTLPRQFSASWVALEDVTLGAGELFYYPGSHRFPDFQYGGAYKNVPEARRMGTPEPALNEQVRKHVMQLEKRAAELGLKKEVFAAKAGDVLIWHPELVHGGNPVSSKITRKSLVTHYCARYAAPVFGEHRGTEVPVGEYQGHLWATDHY